MSSPPAGALVALALTGVCGLVLMAGLVSTVVILRRISTRLVALAPVLGSIGDATDPLTARVAGIAGNVHNLREAAAELSRVVAERAQSGDRPSPQPRGHDHQHVDGYQLANGGS